MVGRIVGRSDRMAEEKGEPDIAELLRLAPLEVVRSPLSVH
jgi:hypothetical protein